MLPVTLGSVMGKASSTVSVVTTVAVVNSWLLEVGRCEQKEVLSSVNSAAAGHGAGLSH